MGHHAIQLSWRAGYHDWAHGCCEGFAIKITFDSPRMLNAMLEKVICIFSVRLIQKQCIEVQELSDVCRLLREVQL